MRVFFITDLPVTNLYVFLIGVCLLQGNPQFANVCQPGGEVLDAIQIKGLTG